MIHDGNTRARRASARMALATRTIMVAIVAVVVTGVAWFAIDAAPFESYVRARFGETTQLGGTLQMAIIAAVIATQSAVLLWAFHRLAHTFDLLAGADPLNAAAARAMRASGSLFAAATVIGIILQVPLTYAITLANAEGARAIAVSISSGHVFGLFAAGALVAVGHVLALAADVQAENRQIV